MNDDSSLPIALRRARRASAAPAAQASPTRASTSRSASQSCPSATSTSTPRRAKATKRVRFSDPGPVMADIGGSSTGLTPSVRRTSLGVSPSPKRRRHSTPSGLRASAGGNGVTDDNNQEPSIEQVSFLPLRQVLDGRVKRRIRRNGLSEEMNTIYQERKRRADQSKSEIQQLKADLAERDEEIRRLHDETTVQDTGRILELERQISALKRDLADRSGTHDRSSSYDWTMAARDPYSDEYSMELVEDGDNFGDVTMADLACSTPTRAQRSFPTPPATSPTMPMTPSPHFSTPISHAGVQASLPDPSKQELEDEIASLQLEICKLNTTLESYSALTMRLSDKVSSCTSADPVDPRLQTPEAETIPNLEDKLSGLVQILSDRTAALLELNTSLSNLGFPGSDSSEIVTSLASAFRTARLELEYLTPGEIALPLTSRGAEVLDLLLDRLRDLARQARDADGQIDEYHALELSLRQQLGARVEAMDGLTREVAQGREALAERDGRVAELEVGVDRLKGAVEGYTRDIKELEALVQRLEGEGEDLAACRERDAAQHAAALADRDSTATDLEVKLAAARAHTSSLYAQLSDLQAAKAAELAALGRAQGRHLALRDARVLELRDEVERVNEALRGAHDAVQALRVENGGLRGRLEEERAQAARAMESMREELERVVRMSAEFLQTPRRESRRGRAAAAGPNAGSDSGIGSSSGPNTPLAKGSAVSPGGFLSGELSRRNSGKGKRRRRYDSGLGFLDEDEVDAVQ